MSWQKVLGPATAWSASASAIPALQTPRPHGYISVFRPLAERALSLWRWIEGKRTQQLAQRRLRVAETVSLGEKRFVSIVQVDGAQFLIGGSADSVSLLAILSGEGAAHSSGAEQTT